MAYIKVDHKKLISAADTIDSYISTLTRNMRDMNQTVDALGAEWKGADYQQLKTQWDEITAAGSISDKTQRSLQDYAAALRETSDMYKDAQARAIDRASSLCK